MRNKAILSAGLLFSLLYGDVMYEMLTTTEGMMGMGGETLVRNFIKGAWIRTETITRNPLLGEVTNISIVRMDKNVVWILDKDKKEYSEIPLGAGEDIEPVDSAGIIPEISIQRCGEKKTILKSECEKYIISMKAQSKEGAIILTQTLWVTKDLPGYEEITELGRRLGILARNMGQNQLLGIDRESLRRLQEKISAIEGFPLTTELDFIIPQEEESLSFKTRSEVTKIDTVPISDKVFEIPPGYRRKGE